MSGYDENADVVGNWIPPSPSPRALFESISHHGINSRPNTDRHSESQMGTPFPQGGEKIETAFSEPEMGTREGGIAARMAAHTGLNVPTLNTGSIIRPHELELNNTYARSPYFTIPPGLSPTTLLESPIFLSCSLAQQSPTTGKFQFAPGGNETNSNLNKEASEKFGNQFENFESTFFSFRPVIESGHSSFLDASSKISSDRIFQSQGENEHSKTQHPQNEASRYLATEFYRGNTVNAQPRVIDIVGGCMARSPSLDEQEDEGSVQMGGGDATGSGDTSEDGYNWRKYGQKQVKGSDYPRSYYKCTHPSCTVKKKVERSHEGHITEIIYKGAHNHPEPHPNRRSTLGLIDCQTGVTFDGSSTFSNDEDEDDQVTHGSASLGFDGVEDESDSKRRKMEDYTSEMNGVTRAIKEPKVVVQATSEVDILDDGYRWRKYGQKVVKGNPNPRSYYKCTSPGCMVRKHIERASHDLKSVITTYEGKHNHDVPAARNSGYSNSASPGNGPAQGGNTVSILTHMQRSEQSQVQNVSEFGVSTAMNSLGFGYGMNEPGLANLVMARLGPNHGTAIQPHLGQVGEMNFVLPKGEPNTEPLSEPPRTSFPNSSSNYEKL